MCDHLMQFIPRHAATIGRDRIETVVRRGIAKAADAGFDTAGPVRLYLDMICLFGSDFATDPQFPWAGEILNAGSTVDQAARADALYRRSLRFLDAVFGPDNRHGMLALGALADWTRGAEALPADGFDAAAADKLEAIWPHRHAHVGAGPLRLLAAKARAQAAVHGLATPRGQTLVFALMVGFGHGFAEDPLYPWFAEDMRRDLVTDPAGRLEARMQAYLSVVMRRARG